MHPDASEFLRIAGIELPLIGLYDAPDRAPFEPSISPKPGTRVCFYAFFKSWVRGESAVFTKEAFGCGGFGSHIFGVRSMPRDAFVDFLYGQEGLKASRELMEEWIDEMPCYEPKNEFIAVGPLKEDMYEHLRTVTFLVDPDQLALMVYATYYHSAPGEPDPLRAPFITDLRADPFEHALQRGASYEYDKWWTERMFLFLPAKAVVGNLLGTFKEFPPRQKPGSFSVGDTLQKIQEAHSSSGR